MASGLDKVRPAAAKHLWKPRPGIAAVLSFLFSGLGQIYNGRISKGLTIMAISAVGMVLVIIGAVQLVYLIYGRIPEAGLLEAGIAFFVLGLILIAATGVYNVHDAYNTAKQIEEGKDE